VNKQSGKLFVFAAPSGAGKTTLVRALLAKHSELWFSISYTTRTPRKNEIDGVDYLFIGKEEFMALRDRGDLLEYAEVFDNYYATSRDRVEAYLRDGRNVILEIDWQGARQVRVSMPECVTIFIMPPTLGELEHRLRDRRTDSDDVIVRRLRDALSDMSHWDEFDHVIINDELDEAVASLESVLDGSSSSSSTTNASLRDAVMRIIG